jgi:hypothetical protein
MFAFLTLNFWIGVVVGASFPLFWAKVWAWLKAKFKKDAPASVQADLAKVGADVAPAVAVVNAVAAPAAAAVEADLTKSS